MVSKIKYLLFHRPGDKGDQFSGGLIFRKTNVFLNTLTWGDPSPLSFSTNKTKVKARSSASNDNSKEKKTKPIPGDEEK